MHGFKVKDKFTVLLLFTCLAFAVTTVEAQRIVKSGAQSAGFRYAVKNIVNNKVAVPVISYQQNIQMLSSAGDQPSLQIFGDGRVHVHYPVYMKKAGDYEMQLNDAELAALIQSLSSNGVMDFDEAKVKRNVQSYQNKLRQKGELYHVSDVVETVVDIKLDEFQKNNRALKIRNFHKQFRWKNIEHDAVRYKHDDDITRAHNSISQLQLMMKDARLVKRNP